MAWRARICLLVAAAGAGALLIGWEATYRYGPTRALDGRGFAWAQARTYTHELAPLLERLLDPLNGALYLLAAVLVVGAAWIIRGAAFGLAAAAVLIGANALTQILKALTAAERPWTAFGWGHGIDPVSWPSGHTTAAAALVVAAVIAAPTVLRLAVAVVGGLWALGAGVAVVGLGWHTPSDAVAAWCVVALVGGLVVAGLVAWEGRDRAPRAARGAAAVGSGAGSLGGWPR